MSCFLSTSFIHLLIIPESITGTGPMDNRTCYRHKRELYSIYRNSNNLELKRYYKVYCKILSNIIKEGKRIYYDKKNPKIKQRR